MSNLKGNTAYLLDIRAVNKVGAGDASEFQILGRWLMVDDIVEQSTYPPLTYPPPEIRV